ncbi:hypothetical protein M885DRAFT_550640 [Pelagophyceae sp. CCMP2097]|nr:hypothetical protein M885DRAFT_550640 [Pelagophyceae sp. CCMP2097]|mmetsp:Transcript_452/g.1546  ORF Transcript_452/g.1546 Transcript_452/m.1546 type:complete len:183 (-) Transcript_452:58-606(-)|eukprot:CAMPEP_0184085892 /NCGR_PEP_ID=MMETSP0974-20121125/4937_1 /TAXON_ID=483370 /ORGANISM="non described non described, Strain CCMP2097" /LENGTH=182 /DNA_ID=CAMNT_0026388575 /DNA_START=65 /DNA_END=613 /DNA_ORIENTATION=+
MAAPTHRVLLLKGEANAAALKGLVQGDMANNAAEVPYAMGFSTAILLDKAALLDQERLVEEVTERLVVGLESVIADFTPKVVVANPVENPLRHVLLIKFKPEANVAELVAGYAALPKAIVEMKKFEWGTISNDCDFTHVFISTFENASARDAYLAHDAHTAYAGELLPMVAGVVVFDFFEAK